VYSCGKTFLVDHVIDLFKETDACAKHALAVIHGESVCIWLLRDGKLQQKLDKGIHTRLPNSHKKGGQSQSRFRNTHDNAVRAFVGSVANYVLENAHAYPDGVLVAGSSEKKYEVVGKIREHREGFVLGCVSCTHRESAQDIVQKNQDLFSDRNEESKTISRWMEKLSLGCPTLVYGVKHIHHHASNGMLSEMLVHEDVLDQHRGITCAGETCGMKTVVISRKTEAANRLLRDFGGVLGKSWYGGDMDDGEPMG
jgi:peptide subunit release factor 1 (eRF1)